MAYKNITITDYIPYGKKNAVHLTELSSFLSFNPATIKKLIQAERRNGTPILSAANGYWQSTDQAEIDQFYSSTRKAAVTRFKTIKGIKRYEAERSGQMNLADVRTELNNREYDNDDMAGGKHGKYEKKEI